MEVIHIILGKAHPEHANGVNKIVYQLATHQQTHGQAVAVWGIVANPVHDYGERNFRTELFKASRNPFAVPAALKKALRERAGQIMVHLHGGWVPVYAPLSALLARLEIPFVITAHGAYNTTAMQHSHWSKQLYFHLFEKKLLHRALRIHALGKSEVAGIQHLFPSQKSVLLPYGFDLDDQGAVPLSSSAPFTIGFVGRLDIHTKGLDLLLDSFEVFLQTVPNARLWLIGDGSDHSELDRELQGTNIQPQVVLWGNRTGDEKAALMRQMHIFAHPSRNEGLPVSVLEAAASGIPLLVSEATNMGGYLRSFNAGIVVPDNNEPALTQGMLALYEALQSGKLLEMSQQAQAMVKTVFKWEILITEYRKNLYNL